MMPSYGGLLQPGGSKRTLLKSLSLMLKISYAGCLGLYPVISAQFALERCRSLKSQKNHWNPLFWEVQGHSRSSTLVPPGSSSAVLVMISSKSVSTRNRSQAKRVNTGRITIS